VLCAIELFRPAEIFKGEEVGVFEELRRNAEEQSKGVGDGDCRQVDAS